MMKNFSKQVFSTVLVMMLASCTNANKHAFDSASSGKVRNQFRDSVTYCADIHQNKKSPLGSLDGFLVIDVSRLNYYIVVSDQTAILDKNVAPFCHVEKKTGEVIYANLNEPYLKPKKGEGEFNEFYDKAYTDQLRIDRAFIAKYRRINGVWRYIEGRSVLGS